ncbi:26S proteasome non-ATPase regulatory subunit 3 [Halotydeus destructor]|nr:26S proteasome non-ATPase regulatory subunit 3 [Halotydeus destructor]
MVAAKKDAKAPEDVEMKAADSPAAGTDAEAPKSPPVDPDTVTLEEVREHAKLIEKSVNTKEPRFQLRVVRSLVTIRKKLNFKVLRKILNGYYTHNAAARDLLIAYTEEPMETEGSKDIVFKPRVGKAASQPLLPELDVYFHLLVVLHLLDLGRSQQALQCCEQLVSKVSGQNRRSLDLIASKVYYYYTRCHELNGSLKQIKSVLHQKLRTATLRNDYEGQAVTVNCLLRIYLHYNHFDQAAKLVSKSTFPETASINEWSRYLYYLGRIRAIQLDYSEAHKNLIQALRKAPQHTAIGFKQTVQKMAVTVELLLGDIPERSLFREATLRRPLAPYFSLTQAVRTGNLKRFNEVVEQFGAKFQQDDTYTLIIRLRHNVIKTGVRMINLSYSKISLADIAAKLLLDTAEDAEYIVAKAIRDGVIEATIDHEGRYLQSKETVDVYATAEPQAAFHQRISFCLDIHNQSVKAMRFPPKSYNTDLESAEERREREQQDLELAKELAEGDEEDGF